MAEARARRRRAFKHWITLGAERRPWAEALDDLLARGSEGRPRAAGQWRLDGLTAGTTGKPKGALRRVTDPARSAAPGRAGLSGTRAGAPRRGPLYHPAGRLRALRAMVGGTVVVMRKFDPRGAPPHRAASLHDDIHGPHAAQAHRRPAGRGARALRSSSMRSLVSRAPCRPCA